MARRRSAGVTFRSLISFGGRLESPFNGLEFFDHFAEFGEGDVLNLSDALARHTKLLTDFFEGLLAAAVQAKSIAKNGRVAQIAPLRHLLQHCADGLRIELRLW